MQKIVDEILKETNYEQNPYFCALRDKSFAKDDLATASLLQHGRREFDWSHVLTSDL